MVWNKFYGMDKVELFFQRTVQKRQEIDFVNLCKDNCDPVHKQFIKYVYFIFEIRNDKKLDTFFSELNYKVLFIVRIDQGFAGKPCKCLWQLVVSIFLLNDTHELSMIHIFLFIYYC